MTRSLRTADAPDAADMPPSAPVPSKLRGRPAGGDDDTADHEGHFDDTDRVGEGNSALPATGLLQVWPLLPTLRLVVELGGVRAAAQALGVQPPAVSKMIRHLEHALGEPLFLRVGRTLVPTERAQRLHRDVRTAMRLIDSSLHGARPLRLVVHPALIHRVLEAARGLPVGQLQQLDHTDEAFVALQSGAVDVVVGCGDVVGGPGLELAAGAVVAEVDVGGDLGRYEGADVAAATAAVRAGYRAWIVAELAPDGVVIHRRRERPTWLATRRHLGSEPLLALRARLGVIGAAPSTRPA